MAPNSEESLRFGQFQLDGTLNKQEKQRPPIYNPEDYALSLKKWGRRSVNGSTTALYQHHQSPGIDLIEQECTQQQQPQHQQQPQQRNHSFRDYTNPMLLATGNEMTLRQFGTVSELLTKLKSDLRLAYPSFVQEFVADPLDGVTLLVDLLRAIQMTESTNTHGNTTGNNNGTNTCGKLPPSLQRRALLDELSCLQCLLHCCQRYNESIQKLIQSSTGLFTIAICIMSNVTKSRILSLELLTKICQCTINGHSAISEAMSTLRLRFGEPVRFRFLIGMLMSCHHNHNNELLIAGMRFLNAFLDTTDTKQKRLYIQAELEQAGLDVATIKQNIEHGPTITEQIISELNHWENNHIDIETLLVRLDNSQKDNENLRDKVVLLERKVQILLEEKGILVSLEQCLKERCSELQEEVLSLKSEKSRKNSSCSSSSKKKAESPHEDEGISSSERSYSPENSQHQLPMFDTYLQNQAISKPEPTKNINGDNDDDDDEETTIDEVIEELKNIINDAETEAYRKQTNNNNNQLDNKANRIETRIEEIASETAIIPTNLHPQPPRRTKSLIHLFIPTEDYNLPTNKELFFENETTYSDSDAGGDSGGGEDEEGSDSLLSASKYQLPRVEKQTQPPTKRSESYRQVIKCEKNDNHRKSITKLTKVPSEEYNSYNNNNKSDLKKKSKSLDRIDDGLDSMVDIVVTDTINLTNNNCLNQSKIFLPNCQTINNYYFPRVQEKKNHGFLIKRGHTNAGLYSGQIKEIYAMTEKFTQNYTKINGKLTDIPSGLY